MLRLRRFKTIGCVLLVVACLGATLLFNARPVNAAELWWEILRKILEAIGVECVDDIPLGG